MFTFKHLHFVRIQERLFQLQYHAPDGRAHTFRDVGQSDKTDGERKTVPGGTLPQNFQVNVVNGNTPQFQRIFRIEKGDRHRGNNTDHIGMREIFAEFRSIADDRAKLDFLAGEISRHHDILGVSLLCDYYILSGGSSITAARLMEGFPEELRQTPSMLFLEQLVSRAKTDVDGKYMDIEGESVDGAVIDLASVVDRDGAMYVLLDFWATWCGACRESLPDLKSAYSEYKGKGFDVYAVSFDGDREQWSDFVLENGLGWTNVIIDIPASGFRDVPEVAAYGVNGLPWNYLIDCSTGIIVGKNLYGEALFSRLSGLLGN